MYLPWCVFQVLDYKRVTSDAMEGVRVPLHFEGFFCIFGNKTCSMRFLGNITWLLLGGLVIALIYYIVGLLMCITIVGIPFGIGNKRVINYKSVL